MKYLVILADGMSDYKIKELGDKTPMEFAQTPNIDRLTPRSLVGSLKTIPDGFPPGSDVANLSVLGYDPAEYYTGRSPLEAVSMGVHLDHDDLALRCNLVTLSEGHDYSGKTMLDYSAGEITTQESREIIHTINHNLGNETFVFYPGISYRHLLVWKKCTHNDFDLTPPHDISNQVIGDFLPRLEHASPLLDMMKKSAGILHDHPVNRKRKEQGKKPASSIWLWGEGRKPHLSSFSEKYGLKGAVVAAVDLVKGLGLCAGLTPIRVEGATGGIKTNFRGKAEAALQALKLDKDFVYLHIESPDEAGHQGDLESKIWSLEQIDREVLGLVLEEMGGFDDIRIMVLCDHPTPVSLRTHTSDPVPYLIYDNKERLMNNPQSFDEEEAARGLYFPHGHQLMDFFIRENVDRR